jgi:hypothetical protein
MAWKAYLEAVTDSPVPTDSFYWTVRFEDVDTSRTIHKQYKVVAGQTLQEMKQLALRDKSLLIEQDQLFATMSSQIGNEIV